VPHGLQQLSLGQRRVKVFISRLRPLDATAFSFLHFISLTPHFAMVGPSALALLVLAVAGGEPPLNRLQL
jgi:hypothetical protein